MNSTDPDIAVLDQRVQTIEKAVVQLDTLLEKVHDRPPTWCAWVMTVGGGIIGALFSWLISCLK